MTAPLTAVSAAAPPDAPPGDVRIDREPDAGWLATYGREKELPPEALAVLRGGGARFASVRHAGAVLATTRFVVEPPWVGISAMEVAPEHRRAGLARHLLGRMADAARQAGARRAWLQVVPHNTAAVTLYHRLGFRVHHTYRYHEHHGVDG